MTNEKRIDPLLNMETVGGGKSIAITNNLHNLKPFIGQKLGQELIDSGIPDLENDAKESDKAEEELEIEDSHISDLKKRGKTGDRKSVV